MSLNPPGLAQSTNFFIFFAVGQKCLILDYVVVVVIQGALEKHDVPVEELYKDILGTDKEKRTT